jgi:LmbE family N-acetylglucosaminyl deacetylase
MMVSWLPRRSDGAALSVLCCGAHPDDIEIGCGGTILRLAAETPGIQVQWVVFSGSPERAREAEQSAARFLEGTGQHQVIVKTFRDAYFPYQGAEIKDTFEELKRSFWPDVVFTHHLKDFHQDHRLLAELTWNTFRDHLIFEYEVAKYEGDLGNPNVFVPLTRPVAERKVEWILDCFRTQSHRSWFRSESFQALMRLRGLECNAPEGFAEAFHCRKIVI